MTNSAPVAGFQFELIDTPDSLDILGVYGGTSAEYAFSMSSNESGTILGFSLSGATIPQGEEILTNILFDSVGNSEICIDEAIVSDEMGEPMNIIYGECVMVSMCPSSIVGDGTLDGFVNVQDVVLLVSYILGNTLELDDCSSNLLDVTYDGYLNVQDVVYLVGYILNNN